MGRVLKELHRSCRREDGGEDLKKGTQQLEVYALEIQMYTEQVGGRVGGAVVVLCGESGLILWRPRGC